MITFASIRAARILVASIGALCAFRVASEEPLTFALAQQRAVARSQQLVAQDAAVAASRQLALAAGQFPDPVLKLGVDNLPVDGADALSIGRDFMTMRRIGLMQELTRGDKRRLRVERYELEAQKSLTEKDASIAAIQRDTALAWLERYYVEATAAVIDEQIAEARLEIESAQSAYRSGRGSQADILAARSALALLEDRASDYRRRIRSAKTVLARWIGEAAQAPLSGRPSLSALRFDPAALDADLAHHPQIAALAKQEEIAANEAEQAQANNKPDWSVELTYSQRGSSYSNMISIGLSVPLQWDRSNRQDHELSAKRAMAEQTRAQREELLRAHVAEAKTMIAEWESGRERLGRYETQLIPLARQRTEAAMVAYRGGKGSLSDVLSARRADIEVRMQALQLDMDTARVWAQLNFLFPDFGDSRLPRPHASALSLKDSIKESK